MTFHVGQKVVCVDDAWTDLLDHERCLKRGAIYIVRWVGAFTYGIETRLCIRVEGIHRGFDPWQPFDQDSYDMPFWSRRFRPIVEKKTDISVFTALLNPSPAKETERV